MIQPDLFGKEPEPKQPALPPTNAYYDEGGRLIKDCAVCGARDAGHGYGVSLLKGQLGMWYCKDHRPDAPPALSLPVDYLCAPLANDEGIVLLPYGIQTSQAKWWMFACFDRHPSVGQRIHRFKVEQGRKLAEASRHHKPIFGSLWSNSQPNLGAGYLYSPAQLQAESYPMPPETDRSGTISERSVRIIKAWLTANKKEWRPATHSEEICGIDLVLVNGDIPIECKSRDEDKDYARLFIQTHERNIDRRYK